MIVPLVNAEIWDKIDQKARQQDLRASTTQKFIAKVGSILAMATDSLLKMLNDTSVPDIDQLVTMNTGALALLGHTMCELSIHRREAIRPHLHKDYASLCASHVPVTTELQGVSKKTLNVCSQRRETAESMKFLINIDCLGTYDVE